MRFYTKNLRISHQSKVRLLVYPKYEGIHCVLVYPMVKDCGSPFVFPIRIKDTDQLSVDKCMNVLGKRGVEIRSLMGGTITEQPAYSHVPTDSLSNCISIRSK